LPSQLRRRRLQETYVNTLPPVSHVRKSEPRKYSLPRDSSSKGRRRRRPLLSLLLGWVAEIGAMSPVNSHVMRLMSTPPFLLRHPVRSSADRVLLVPLLETTKGTWVTASTKEGGACASFLTSRLLSVDPSWQRSPLWMEDGVLLLAAGGGSKRAWYDEGSKE
jgi:hypothetical protein